MIRNIIFDMGNVLLYFNREWFMDRFELSAEDRAILTKEVFMSLEWAQTDRGSLDEEDAYRIISQRIPERLKEAARKLLLEWDKPIFPMPGMAELIKELKEKGYGIYLLSNASRRQHEYWPRVPGCEYFDGTVVSADLHLVKPQPEIYQYLLNRFKLNRDECVFIDDSCVNAEGAYNCGMHGLVFFGDAARLRRDLKNLGVDVES